MRFRDLEEEMRTTNAHLDNLVRATGTTNDLLREDLDNRKRHADEKAKAEEEERLHRRELAAKAAERQATIEEDKRTLYKKYAEELWGTFKAPLAYLGAALVYWAVTSYLREPPVGMTAINVNQPPASNPAPAPRDNLDLISE